MIVRILSRGSSFKGLSAYLTHDPDAETDKRVGWTHTLNLANDHVPSAVDEMLWTARAAELLKQEAGIRAGGRETENTVKHLSLNWSPEDSPTREHMIETSQAFLKHMGWQEHQALIVAHTDKEYAHAHLMINCIHPETGLCLDDSFEKRRAQAFALQYEQEQGRIYCEQRLLNAGEREDAPTRPAWMAFKEKEKEFSDGEKSLRENNPENSENQDNSKIANFAEWKRLKEIQKQQRLDFFENGRSEFSELRKAVYREVREEFRENWADYYARLEAGGNAEELAEIKAKLVAEQKELLESRRDEACKELRETRDERYRQLLDEQKEFRQGLRNRQEAGLENSFFFEAAANRNRAGEAAEPDIREAFRSTANELTEKTGTEFCKEEEPANDAPVARPYGRDDSRMKSGPDAAARVGEGLGFGLISFMESLADGFVGATPAPRQKRPEPEPAPRNAFDEAAEEAVKRQQREQQDAADEEWRKKQRSYGE